MSTPSGLGARACKEPRRVLDDATRMRRKRKAIESLEFDNFHDDPHANLVKTKSWLITKWSFLFSMAHAYALNFWPRVTYDSTET